MVKKRNFRQNEVNPQETGAIPFFCLSGLSFPFVKDDWSIYPGGRAVEVHSNCTIANPIPGQMAWARNVLNSVWIGSRGKRVRLLHCPESHCCYHLPPLRQSGSGTSKLDAFLFLSLPKGVSRDSRPLAWIKVSIPVTHIKRRTWKDCRIYHIYAVGKFCIVEW